MIERHVADPTTGVHRYEGGELTFACAECDMDWPCDVVLLTDLDRLAAALNDAALEPAMFKLGRDLRVPAGRIVAVLKRAK